MASSTSSTVSSCPSDISPGVTAYQGAAAAAPFSFLVNDNDLILAPAQEPCRFDDRARDILGERIEFRRNDRVAMFEHPLFQPASEQLCRFCYTGFFIRFRLPAQILDDVEATRLQTRENLQKGVLLMVAGMAGIIQHDKGGGVDLLDRFGDLVAFIHVAAMKGEPLILEPREIRDIEAMDMRVGKVFQPHAYRRCICRLTLGRMALLRATDQKAHFENVEVPLPVRMQQH